MFIDVGHRRHLPRAAVATLAVAALLTGPVTPAAAGPPSGQTAHPAAGRSTTVTLITGDVVRLVDAGGGRQIADVRRPARAPGGVRTETIGGDLYVWPDEALPLLAADRLDRRLFDVSLLVRSGYDDAKQADLPLIATTAAPPPNTAKVRDLPSVHGSALRATKQRIRQTWEGLRQNTKGKVWLDGTVKADLAESTAQIGAPEAWAAGLTGTGVKVAVLDTGVDLSHPDLAGRVSATASFVPGETADDGNGHGTHTISTVGGSGAASGGAERGVAPGADLIAGKVLGDDGSGADSWVIAGMEWAVAQHAKVVSMSLGDSVPSDGSDPVSAALNSLSEQSGTLFVVAAGNTGAEAAMGAPGVADAALTVAAVDRDDQLAYFSSRGPRYGDYGLKPDIAAPGVDILAAKATRTGGNASDGWYTTMSGTSMATPHVAGAAAILAQRHPDWSGARLKDALMSSSTALPGLDAYAVGAGRVDVPASVDASVTATGSLWFGFFGWPHDAPAPVERTVTYRNDGDAAVTLSLAQHAAIAGGPYDVDPAADAGTPAPAGMFTLSAGTVTVPAHGTASVTVTAKPNLAKTARRYLGEVVATAAGRAVRTQFGLYTEDERHNLHVSVRDRSGRPAQGYLEVQAFGQVDPFLFAVDGDLDVRLLKGTYSALTLIPVTGDHGPDSQAVALLGDPEIVLDRDRSVTLDARQAKEVTARLPGSPRTEDRVIQLNWYRSDGGDSTVDEQILLGAQYDEAFVLPTRKVTAGAFEYETRWRKAYPLLALGDGLSFLGQPGSAFYDGRDNLDVVRAGLGAEADYAGRNVRGKAVVVTRSDTVSPSQRAANAVAAGARLLIVVNDGPGKLLEWVGADDGTTSPIPVVSVTARTGATLPGRLRVEGVPDSPYVYDLVDQHAGRIPADLTYRPRAQDLARVDMRFYGTAATPSGEYRWAYRPYRQFGVGFLQAATMPGTRTDYVSAPPGTTWAEDALTGPGLAVESRSGLHAYAAGSRTASDWFAPVAHPRNGSGFWWSERQPGFAEFNVQPWTDSGVDHGGYMQDGTDQRTFTVREDGQLVATSEWPSASISTATDGPETFTLDLRASRDPALYTLSTSSHTSWTVKARPPTGGMDVLPLMQLDYTVDTDLSGTARGGRNAVGVRAGHLPGAIGGGTVTAVTFAVSFDDGGHWQPVALDRGVARFNPPRGAAYVSLKATARDDRGNTIEQEVIRAYALPDRHHGD
ncbi:S8 family serine peptidase [Dactylosporangium sp. McL0621]|uniref:S8 family serine peptidase n=1 Tax=Dactylosporangium sp. McL0621 TaxID=3415678 RepID=UPI003CF3988A